MGQDDGLVRQLRSILRRLLPKPANFPKNPAKVRIPLRPHDQNATFRNLSRNVAFFVDTLGNCGAKPLFASVFHGKTEKADCT